MKTKRMKIIRMQRSARIKIMRIESIQMKKSRRMSIRVEKSLG